jgi:hypothetical protein
MVLGGDAAGRPTQRTTNMVFERNRKHKRGRRK